MNRSENELLVSHADAQHRLAMHGDLRGIYGEFAPYDLETGKLVDLADISRTITDDDPLCDDWQTCDVCNAKVVIWLRMEADYHQAIAVAEHAEFMQTEDGKLADAGWVLVNNPELKGKWYTNGVTTLRRKDITLDGYYNGEVPKPSKRAEKRRQELARRYTPPAIR